MGRVLKKAVKKPKPRLKELLSFVRFTNDFQKVERTILVAGKNRNENDSEHSFQLAILGWYIIENDKLNLDINKVLKFAIVHDLVETYAGDTFIFGDKNHVADKAKREAKAQKRIQRAFPSWKGALKLIEEYEHRKSPESKFVYVLDKIIPVINIFLDEGRTWKKHKISLEMLREAKDKKVKLNSDLEKYWLDLMAVLEKNRKKLFQN